MDHAHMDHAHMDHSMMDHSSMDHSHHMGMDHGDMGNMCSMNMLFTWDTKNLCIVFRSWHVRSTPSLVLSLLAVVLIGMGYEGIRALSRNYEIALQKRIDALPSPNNDVTEGENGTVTETTTPFFLRAGQHREGIIQRGHIIKAVLYGIQNFYAFMLMLIFMTYNGWVMIAVSLGAFFGYLAFGKSIPSTKETACH